MQTQISFQGLPHSDALRQAIVDKAASLERFYERITSCRVVVETPGRHKQHGKVHSVRIDLRVPEGEIAITHQENEDLQVALRDAFDAARRRLEDYARTQRGDVKQHTRTKA
jgi:ribosomal subunit interface protein